MQLSTGSQQFHAAKHPYALQYVVLLAGVASDETGAQNY